MKRSKVRAKTPTVRLRAARLYRLIKTANSEACEIACLCGRHAVKATIRAWPEIKDVTLLMIRWVLIILITKNH